VSDSEGEASDIDIPRKTYELVIGRRDEPSEANVRMGPCGGSAQRLPGEPK
jgi:hypothetical protein